jgi:pinin
MTDLSVLQEQLESQKKSLKSVDESIKRLSGKEEAANSEKDANNHNKSARLNSRVVNYSTSSALTVSKRKYQNEHRINGKQRNSNDFDSGDEDPTTIKKRTLQSSVVSSNMPIKSKEDLIKLQNKHNGSEQRNKRIFGVLLGTLKQFKSDDTERSATSQAKQRKELEKKIEVKKVDELAKILNEKRRLVEEKNKQLRNIEIIEEKIKLTQDFELWKKNHEPLAKFIRTAAKPFIFYLPKVIDSKVEKLVQDTYKLINEEITIKSKETQAKLDRLIKESEQLTKGDTTEKQPPPATAIIVSSENKENSTKAEENSCESELDEDKNDGVVRIGDDDDEEVTSEKVVLITEKNEAVQAVEDTKKT